MKASGVISDTLTLNLVIKAFSRCLEMDEAVRVFKEMGLYVCEPNEYSYGYIAKGLSEKGRTEERFRYFKEMREKGLVPTSTMYSGLVYCLDMERRFEEAVKVMFDMLENGHRPDILTYRTLLEEMCRDGRADDVFERLEELGDRPGVVGKGMYDDLFDGLHWLCKPHDMTEGCSCLFEYWTSTRICHVVQFVSTLDSWSGELNCPSIPQVLSIEKLR